MHWKEFIFPACMITIILGTPIGLVVYLNYAVMWCTPKKLSGISLAYSALNSGHWPYIRAETITWSIKNFIALGVGNLMYMYLTMTTDDNHGSSTEQSEPSPKWRRFFRDIAGRWRMFRLSNQAIAYHLSTRGCEEAIRNDFLRCHLFGIAVRRKNGLDRRSL